MEKINKLQEFIKNSHEAILIHSPENRRYFTDFPSSDAYLVVTKDDAVFVTDSRYIEAAQRAVILHHTMQKKKKTFSKHIQKENG